MNELFMSKTKYLSAIFNLGKLSSQFSSAYYLGTLYCIITSNNTTFLQMYGGRFYTFVLVLALNNKTEYDEWALPNQKALSHFIFSP